MILHKLFLSSKKGICILSIVLFSSLSSYGQIFIKGSGLFLPPVMDDWIASYSLATEYKNNKISIEYLYNNYLSEGAGLFKSNKHQFGIKYYLKNSESKIKLYVSPFLNLLNMEANEFKESYTQENDPNFGLHEKAKGTGYGVSIGSMIDFGKHIGIEIAPYYYYLHTNTGNKFSGETFYVYSRLASRSVWGLRFFLYLKFNAN